MTPEPWLRGDRLEVPAPLRPLFYSFTQVREDLAHHTDGLTPAQVWHTPHGLGSLGFHLRHLAGSVDRLSTYLAGGELTPAQLANLQNEPNPGTVREELLAGVDAALARAEQIALSLDLAKLEEPRTVGRQHLPTTVIGLLFHLAEHTQRHLGQAISAAKLCRALG